MMRKTRGATLAAFGASIAMLVTACGGGGEAGSGGEAAEGDEVTMTFWHNSTTGPGKAYWESTVADFEEANPGVTIEIQSIQNEDMDGKLQTALNSGDAPDIFMARGGGKLKDVVEAGQVRIRKDVVAEERTLEVPVTEERVRVERRVVDRPVSAADADAFEETVIDVPLRSETVDVQKQARVAEEIVVSKEAVERTEQVTYTVRREEVYVDEDATVLDETEGGSSRSR